MAFDTTNVAATVGQGVAPINPLDMVEKLAATRNALNQNRLFQSQQAAGHAFQGAINPDGTFNQNALMTGLAGNPHAALAAQAAAGAGASLQGAGIANVTAQQSQAAARIGRIQTLLGAIPAGPEQQALAEGLLRQQVKAGAITPEDAANVLGGNIPGMPSISAQAKVGAVASGSESDQAAQFGTPTPISTGGGTKVEDINRVTGGLGQIGETIPNTPAPTVAGVDTGTGTQFVGVDPNTGKTTPIGGPITKNLSTGTQIWVANPSEPGGGHFAVTSPNGPVQNQPPLGAVAASNAAASAIGAGSGTSFVALQQKADAAKANLATASELEQLINNPNYAPGPKAATIQHMGALAQQFGITLPPNWQQGTANIELAHKLQAVMVSQSLQSFNEGVSDARQALSTSTNVQNEISRLGQQSIMPTIQGISDAALAKQALGNEWLKKHPTGEGYSSFATQYNARVDPMIFAYEHMPKAMQRQFTQGMTPEQSKAFNASQKWATEHGILAP